MKTKGSSFILVVFEIVLFSIIVFPISIMRAEVPQSLTHVDLIERPGFPISLRIPKIGVDAPIKLMGVTSEGDMEAPKAPQDTGWYKFGPRPGDIGSAVIAGHFGPWKTGGTSAFDDLHELEAGDRIYIEDEEGAVIIFVVRESRSFGENDDASSVFTSNDGKAHLNLITCEGVWNKARKSYSNRLIVFTDKEIDLP
jgi:LPXTG-site transpeptidase (sortase) family protein